ncbi:MAG: ATP phosphoribosyltransferase [Coriobacteriales bacterium]|jgi:ATP phosphoribosyltransferase regulatory subunit|nr:ATP phosphoribosyltransferase [Coriobacteriales bacterium]
MSLLKIALPKGNLYADSVQMLTAAGLDTSGLSDPGRLLVIRNGELEFYIVRPTDVPAFVSLGGVDCAICGRDSLAEQELPVAELVDLGFGACMFVVAEPKDADQSAKEHYRRRGLLRVASKYPNITQRYYDSIGAQVEIVKIHGNVELAPRCGIAERIVDITATGATLRENNLVVVDKILDSTARFVGNLASVRTDVRVRRLAHRLRDLVELAA